MRGVREREDLTVRGDFTATVRNAVAFGVNGAVQRPTVVIRHLKPAQLTPPARSATVLCNGCQAGLVVYAGSHARFSRSIVLRMVSNFRMHAVSATFLGFPAATRRT